MAIYLNEKGEGSCESVLRGEVKEHVQFIGLLEVEKQSLGELVLDSSCSGDHHPPEGA